jgi:HlyD family secretion protein
MNRNTLLILARTFAVGSLAALALAGCGRKAPPPQYQTAKAETRDIVVAVDATGTVEPLVTVEIKSKASGEILSIHAETGDYVKEGTLLVQVDKRTPRNLVAQTAADLEAARSRRAISEAQTNRSKKLLAEKMINDVDYEKSLLDFANAKADVVRTEVAWENARIGLDDTDVRAPTSGTIIDRLVSPGAVISSPLKDFGGGTLLLKMADLSVVQVRTKVDETDVGKIRPGLPVSVKVTAYPNQPFEGEVFKIEPQAKDEQNVTTFPILIRLDNKQGLLRPGMNADVRIRVAERSGVLAIPTIALRTPRDIATAAGQVGLTEQQVREQLGGVAGGDVTASGQSRNARKEAEAAYAFGGRYWVFAKRDGKPVATNVTTGLTDLDYSEVTEGIKPGDEVLMLPSSGLVESQQRMREQMSRFGGMPGMNNTAKPAQGQAPGQQPGQPQQPQKRPQ